MMDYGCESRIARFLIQGEGRRALCYYRDWLEARQADCFNEANERFSEKSWQQYLYQKRLGSRWTSEDGEAIEILDFGKWNHEEGPDFLGAIIKFGNQPPIKGDLELDHDVRDWERHGHAQNANYRNVLVHFFFEKPRTQVAFTRNIDGKKIQQISLDTDHLEPSHSISLIKRSNFSGVNSDDILQLLKTAARFRMHRKSQSFRRQALLFGFTQALFQAIACALGYRPNSIPFGLLAQRVHADLASSNRGEALLFGVAGFLRGEQFTQVPQDTRKYLRGLWDSWWGYRDQFFHSLLPAGFWKSVSVRPLNYPQRRLGALALIAAQIYFLQKLVQTSNEDGFIKWIRALYHPFWQTHYSFFAKSERSCLLVGEERSLDLLVNVFYPAQNLEDPAIWSRFESVRLPTVPKRMIDSISAIIGTARLPHLSLKEATIQQGILQMLIHFERFNLSI